MKDGGRSFVPWPSDVNLRERDIKPAQAALVKSQGGERCVEKAEEPLSGKYLLRDGQPDHVDDIENEHLP